MASKLFWFLWSWISPRGLIAEHSGFEVWRQSAFLKVKEKYLISAVSNNSEIPPTFCSHDWLRWGRLFPSVGEAVARSTHPSQIYIYISEARAHPSETEGSFAMDYLNPGSRGQSEAIGFSLPLHQWMEWKRKSQCLQFCWHSAAGCNASQP